MSKSVRRITVLDTDTSCRVRPVTVFKRGGKKKVTRGLKPIEQIAWKLAKSSDSAARTYLRRYKKSSRKRRDGWLRDMPTNMMRSGTKAVRQLSPVRLFSF
jgi:hypothetical protein